LFFIEQVSISIFNIDQNSLVKAELVKAELVKAELVKAELVEANIRKSGS
jgi:hypothetical protein